MTVYKGNQKESKIYKGETKIGKIYKGSTLIYSASLPSGTVIFESATPGTYTVNITSSQNYYIDLVGGGGGGHVRSGPIHPNFGGGSGGYVYGTILIPKGNYTLVIGNGGTENVVGGDSSFYNQIAGGGKSRDNGYAGGKCSTSLSYTNGKSGGKGVRGESVYNGYGRGGYAHESGTSGFARIITA